jgi:hypothetical protein
MRRRGLVRKQVYIEARHERLLKRWASERGVTEAELIRSGIDQLERAAPPPTAPDADAWRRELAFLRRRQETLPPLGRRRTWRREDLYAQRIGRSPR